MDKGVFVIGSISTEQVLQAVDLAVEMHLCGDDGLTVPAYDDSNVSTKVVKLIQSYTGIKIRWFGVNNQQHENNNCLPILLSGRV